VDASIFRENKFAPMNNEALAVDTPLSRTTFFLLFLGSPLTVVSAFSDNVLSLNFK
jgi:hypothetical protein